MDIYFFAGFEDETDDDLTIVMNETKTVREMILHVLQEFGKECNEGIEKYCVMYGQKLISSEQYLDKTLKEIGLKNKRRLKIMSVSNLIPA
jgi:hypothetical protein